MPRWGRRSRRGRSSSARTSSRPGRQGEGEKRTVVELPPVPFGGPTGYGQIVGADGTVVKSPSLVTGADSRRAVLPVTQRTREVASGLRGPSSRIATCRARMCAYTRAHTAGEAIQVARPLDEVDGSLRTLGLVLGALNLGGVVLGWSAGLPRVAGHPASRCPAHRRGRARVAHPRSQPPDRRGLTRRARPPRRELQHHARGARRVAAHAAPAGGGRIPRAAHAAHEPAHQYRAARPRGDHARRRPAAPAARPDGSARGAHPARGRPRGARPGRGTRTGGGGRAARPRRGGRRRASHASRTGRRVLDRARTLRCRGRSGAHRPRGCEPARQRTQVEPARRAD